MEFKLDLIMIALLDIIERLGFDDFATIDSAIEHGNERHLISVHKISCLLGVSLGYAEIERRAAADLDLDVRIGRHLGAESGIEIDRNLDIFEVAHDRLDIACNLISGDIESLGSPEEIGRLPLSDTIFAVGSGARIGPGGERDNLRHIAITIRSDRDSRTGLIENHVKIIDIGIGGTSRGILAHQLISLNAYSESRLKDLTFAITIAVEIERMFA